MDIEKNTKRDIGPNNRDEKHRPISATISILSIVFGAASLISLFQRWTGVEIYIEIFYDALSIYRQFATTLKSIIFDWWMPVELPFSIELYIPDWGFDIMVLWLLFCASISRYDAARERIFLVEFPEWVYPTPYYMRVFNLISNFLIFPILLKWVYWFVYLMFWGLDHYSWMTLQMERLLVSPVGLRDADLKRAGYGIQIHGDWWKNGELRLKRMRHRAVFAAISPVFLTVLFFIWNAIQISP